MSRLAFSTLVCLFALVALAQSQYFGRRRPVTYESSSLRNRWTPNVGYYNNYIAQPNYYNAGRLHGHVYRRPSRWSSVSSGPVRGPNRYPIFSRPNYARNILRPALNQTALVVAANSTASTLNQTAALNGTSVNSTVVLTNLTNAVVNSTAIVVEPVVLESVTSTVAPEATSATPTKAPEPIPEVTAETAATPAPPTSAAETPADPTIATGSTMVEEHQPASS